MLEFKVGDEKRLNFKGITGISYVQNVWTHKPKLFETMRAVEARVRRVMEMRRAALVRVRVRTRSESKVAKDRKS